MLYNYLVSIIDSFNLCSQHSRLRSSEEGDDVSCQVSADGEEALYKACMDAGITMLSIGHRPALRKYHQMIVHFDGSQSGRGWRLEELSDQADLV